MADRKITDLTALTTPASNDVLPIVDVSEAAAVDKNKKITVEELLRGAPNGTAAAPSFAFESDGGNGLYLAGTDTVGISTNGTGRLFVDSSGQVGIGASPTDALFVGGAAVNFNVRSTSSSASTSIKWGNDLDTKSTEMWVNGSAVSTFGGASAFNVYQGAAAPILVSTNGSERLRITSDGKLGLGSSSPQAKLEIAQSSDNTDGPKLRIANNGNTLSNGQLIGGIDFFDGDDSGEGVGAYIYSYTTDSIGRASGQDLRFGAGESERMRLDSSGRLGVGTTSPGNIIEARKDQNAGTKVIVSNQTNGASALAGIDLQAYGGGWQVEVPASATYVNPLAFSFNGSEKLRVDSSGRVGIGTSTPSDALTISKNNCLAIAGTGFTSFGGTDYYHAKLTLQDPSSRTVILRSPENISEAAIGTSTNHVFTFITNNVERARFDTSGRLGIGTTSISGFSDYTTVQLGSSSSGTALRLVANGDTPGTDDFVIYKNTSGSYLRSYGDPIVFYGSSSEYGRWDTSGRLLVGTSSSASQGCALQVRSDIGVNAEFFRSADNSGGPYIALTKTRGTAASPTEVSSGDDLGTIDFLGYDGATYRSAATIQAQADGTWTDGGDTTDNPGRLVFSTTADGASSPTERMRITSGGNALIGCQALPSASVEGFVATGTSSGNRTSSGSSTSAYNHWLFYNGNGVVGSISTSGSATTYATSSDYRLKENVTAVTDGITRLQQLKPSRFNFIADPDKTVDGFLAHEVQTIVPEAITGEKDAVDADGKPIYQGIDQSKLVPLLTAALQEAIGEIESLKARVAALESA